MKLGLWMMSDTMSPVLDYKLLNIRLWCLIPSPAFRQCAWRGHFCYCLPPLNHRLSLHQGIQLTQLKWITFQSNQYEIFRFSSWLNKEKVELCFHLSFCKKRVTLKILTFQTFLQKHAPILSGVPKSAEQFWHRRFFFLRRCCLFCRHR